MTEENELLQKARQLVLEMIKNNQSDPWQLASHLPEVEKWGRFLLEKYPEADKDVVLLSSWLHDCGHYPITETDHAIKGERIAKEFLEKENFDGNKSIGILHCIRAHRCKDVEPKTLEAKMIACADSASHMTDPSMYPSMIKEGRPAPALDKLERDYRDTGSFPEVREKIRVFYEVWKKILIAFIDLDIKK